MNFSNPTNRLKILHVEDNPGDVYVIRRVLKNYDTPNELHNIADGESAIEFLQKSQTDESACPDLVLLDINLPSINGDEVLKWIRNEEFLKDLPVIVLSSSSSKRDIEKMTLFGANAYVTKPDDLDGYSGLVKEIDNHC